MTFSNPYNDETMYYDIKTHRYVLCLSYAKSLVGNAYNDDGVMDKRLKEISLNVYNFIYSQGHTSNKKYTKLFLNATENGRNLLIEALGAQLSADAENGYNDMVKQNPIDFNSGNVIDRDKIIYNQVCIQCQKIIENSPSDLDGYQIVCQIPYYIPSLENILEQITL